VGSIVPVAGSPSVQAVAPGSLVSIFGSGLASEMASSDTVPLSTTLKNVSVKFNDISAPVQFVSAGQLIVQAPWGVPVSDGAQVVVTNNGVASAAMKLPIMAAAPAIFNIGGQAIAVNPDGSLAAPANSIPGISTRPAKIGDTLVILATGLGAVDSAMPDGAPSSDQVRNTVLKPTVVIGGVAATVTFSGLSPQFVGINQINVTIAGGTPTGNAIALQIQVDGVASSNGTTVAIGQ